MALDRGFGSSSRFSGAYDWGFGDPTPTSWAPATDPQSPGFGDPTTDPAIPLPLNDDPRYSDEGGEIVNLVGAWPLRGPYKVRLDDGSTLYPEGGFCYGARVGSGDECFTEPQLKILSFALPPLPLGVYALVIYYGAAFGSVVRLENAIEIVTRGQAPEIYAMRGRFPRFWKVGPPSAQIQSDVLPEHPTAPLYTLIRTMGQVAQQLTGSPFTRLSAPLLITDASASVESVLGFPETGAEVWIGGRLYAYTGIAGSVLTGLELISASNGAPLNPRTEVILNARSLLPD